MLLLNQEIKELRQAIDSQKQDLQKTTIMRQIYEQAYGVKLDVDDVNSLRAAADLQKKQEDILR